MLGICSFVLLSTVCILLPLPDYILSYPILSCITHPILYIRSYRVYPIMYLRSYRVYPLLSCPVHPTKPYSSPNTTLQSPTYPHLSYTNRLHPEHRLSLRNRPSTQRYCTITSILTPLTACQTDLTDRTRKLTQTQPENFPDVIWKD